MDLFVLLTWQKQAEKYSFWKEDMYWAVLRYLRRCTRDLLFQLPHTL